MLDSFFVVDVLWVRNGHTEEVQGDTLNVILSE